MAVSQRYSKWKHKNSELLKFKERLSGKTPAAGDAEDVEIVALFDQLWRTVELPLINCKINLQVIWLENFVISN